MRRLFLALGGLALLLSACGGAAAHHIASPTTSPLPPAATSTTTVARTTTTVPDTAVVPAKITVAYVDAVFGKLDAIYGDAVRSVRSADRLTTSVEADLGSIYSPSLLQGELVLFEKATADGFPNIKKNPRNRITKVRELIHASENCIFAKVEIDQGPQVVHPVSSVTTYYKLSRKRTDEGQQGINPTPWVYSFNLVTTEPSQRVPDQCG